MRHWPQSITIRKKIVGGSSAVVAAAEAENVREDVNDRGGRKQSFEIFLGR